MTSQFLTGALLLIIGVGISQAQSKQCAKLDLVVVIDASGSVYEVFKKQQKLAITILKDLQVSSEGVNIALVAYSFNANKIASLKKLKDTKSVLKTIDDLKLKGGTTNVVSSFSAASEILKTSRSDAEKVVLIITDGHSQNKLTDIAQKVADLNKEGAIIYATTESDDPSLPELELYTGSRSKVYLNKNVNGLKAELKEYSGGNCTAAPSPNLATVTGTPHPYAPPLLATTTMNSETLEPSTVKAETPEPSTTARATTVTPTIPVKLTTTVAPTTPIKRTTTVEPTTPVTTTLKPQTTTRKQTARPTPAPTPVPTKAPKLQANCAADVLIVLDASGSVRDDFQRNLNFITEIVNFISVAPDRHRLALIGYSGPTRRRLIFDFNKHTDKESLIEYLPKIPYFGGTTATGEALKLAVNALKERRPTVPTFVLVLTDGFSQDKVTLSSGVIRKMNNVQLFAIALQDSIYKEGLMDIAGDEDHIFASGTNYKAVVKELKSQGLDCATLPKLKTDKRVEASQILSIRDALISENKVHTNRVVAPNNSHQSGGSSSNRVTRPSRITRPPRVTRPTRVTRPRRTNPPRTTRAPRVTRPRRTNPPRTTRAPRVTRPRRTNPPRTTRAPRMTRPRRTNPPRTTRSPRVTRPRRTNPPTTRRPRTRATFSPKTQATQPPRTRTTQLATDSFGRTRATDPPRRTRATDPPRRLWTPPQNQPIPPFKPNPGFPWAGEHLDGQVFSYNTPAPAQKVAVTERLGARTYPTLPPLGRQKRSNDQVETSDLEAEEYEVIDQSEDYEPTGCEIDLVLMLDASGQNEDAFVKQTRMALQIIANMDIGPLGDRVALVKYADSGKSKTVFKLNQHQTNTELSKAISSARWMSGSTPAIHEALELGADLLQPENNGRPASAQQIGILFSDGISTQNPFHVAQTLRDNAVVYSVSISKDGRLNLFQLAEIAGSFDRVFESVRIHDFIAQFKVSTQACLQDI